MEENSCKLALLTANLKVTESIGFDSYLKEVWMDLISRITKNKNDKINKKIRQDLLGLTKVIFTQYYSLPGIIGHRLFRVFDTNNNGVLEYNEFKTGMFTLFCGNYEKTLRFIFDFYDFDADGKISKEDIRIVLTYIYINENENKYTENIQNIYEDKINNLLNICFDKQPEFIDYLAFTHIVETINYDIYFKIYLFLLKKKPFCFKSLKLYFRDLENILENNELNKYQTENKMILRNMTNINTNNNIYYSNSNLNLRSKKIPINNYLYYVRSDTNVYSTTNNIKIFSNSNTNLTYKEFKQLRKKSNDDNEKRRINFKDTEFMKSNKNESNIFEQNLEKTIFEARIPYEIVKEIDDIQKYDEENDEFEIEEEVGEIKENLESERNNCEGYIYKLNKGKMVKVWFNLYYKDLFYFKNQLDIKHIGMHNLSGLFLREEPTKILDDKIYFSFSINFPNKKRIYFCDNKSEFKIWKNCLKIATNYSNILEMYKIIGYLGKGSFSSVNLAIDKITKQKVAIKIMDKKRMTSSLLESSKTEIEIMKICQFPYIIKFIDAYENIDNIYIFMEYCSGGTLFSFLKKRDFVIEEKLAVIILYKICLAVFYFHSYGIAHRDLKPENVLMTSENDDADIRILDFGLGKIVGPNEKCSEPYGTLIYVAPEIILDKPYTKIVDSWSIGVIAYILFYGRLPFWHEERKKLKEYITKNQPVFKGKELNNISDECVNFVMNLLIKEPSKRMSVKQALQHKMFQKYNLQNTILLSFYGDEKNLNELKNILKKIQN